MSAPELKPCPFCGDTMEMNCAGYANHTHQNPLCPISQMGFTDLLKWNTRADLCDSTQDERVRALVAENARLKKDLQEMELHMAAQMGALTPNELKAALAALEQGEG